MGGSIESSRRIKCAKFRFDLCIVCFRYVEDNVKAGVTWNVNVPPQEKRIFVFWLLHLKRNRFSQGVSSMNL